MIDQIFREAQHQVLKWARNRAGDLLPKEAWDGRAFEAFAVGRTVMATAIDQEGVRIWSLRGDDPDKTVAGRIWSTEISLGYQGRQDGIRLGVRSIVNSSEAVLTITPSVPGLVYQIAQKIGLSDGIIKAHGKCWWARTLDDVDKVIRWIFEDARRLPLIVVTEDDRRQVQGQHLQLLNRLAKSLCGLAHVVFIPASLNYRLSAAVGEKFKVFHGGLRVYQPGFNIRSDERDHRMFFGDDIVAAPRQILSSLAVSTARESLSRTRLGNDVLSFAKVRDLASRTAQETDAASSAGEGEKLRLAQSRIETMEELVSSLQEQCDQAFELSAEEEARAFNAERQLASANARLEQLEYALQAAGSEPPAAAPTPEIWDDVTGWVDAAFPSKLVLSSAARRSLRKPEFRDVAMAVRCLQWLAGVARDRFIDGGGALANIAIENGITNAPCGSDEYLFDYQSNRYLANWHVKNGGNTRQPDRCLRIYYAFDPVTRQIIIADMPAHRRTGAS
ncbi:hypothetical protein [Sphingomonas sp. S-NIH.Pt15_0812]|uniref:hypothetical protein n=1 Tax=Sphingomonas sp. S-NIH.Pt15_0812 TaxID=1920129 RepID=UPI000F7F9FDF|nr:hypothetical protein [Sphingomonas sp. S-NIH.Pt15_0812]